MNYDSAAYRASTAEVEETCPLLDRMCAETVGGIKDGLDGVIEAINDARDDAVSAVEKMVEAIKDKATTRLREALVAAHERIAALEERESELQLEVYQLTDLVADLRSELRARESRED